MRQKFKILGSIHTCTINNMWKQQNKNTVIQHHGYDNHDLINPNNKKQQSKFKPVQVLTFVCC